MTALSIVTPDNEAGPPPERRTAVDSEGFRYDVDSGEVLGFEGVTDAFVIDDREKAEWALRVRSEVEGQIAGVDARRRALLEGLDRQRAALVRRLSWWEWRFGGQLVAFARTLLGGKGRTVQFDWGKVSFRRTPGASEIVDMAAAVAYVEQWAPGEVRVVKSVGVKAVEAARRAAEAATGEAEGPLPFVAATGPGEAVAVATGVELGGTKG